jgi:putative transposase
VGLAADPGRAAEDRDRHLGHEHPPHHGAETSSRTQAGHLAPVHEIAGVLDHRLRPVHGRVGQATTLHVLFFIELHTRRVLTGGVTDKAANLAWATQIARSLSGAREDRSEPVRFLVHDRDKRFGACFDEVFKAEGIEIVRTRWRAPKANAYAERWTRTARAECLDRVMVLGRCHLEQLLTTYVKHYNEERPHRSLGLEPPGGSARLRALSPEPGEIGRRDRLGGLIHEYYRKAA